MYCGRIGPLSAFVGRVFPFSGSLQALQVPQSAQHFLEVRLSCQFVSAELLHQLCIRRRPERFSQRPHRYGIYARNCITPPYYAKLHCMSLLGKLISLVLYFIAYAVCRPSCHVREPPPPPPPFPQTNYHTQLHQLIRLASSYEFWLIDRRIVIQVRQVLNMRLGSR